MSEFRLAPGMMERDDDVSTPYGSVVIQTTDTTVISASYRIVPTRDARRDSIQVRSVATRTVGVDHLPAFNQWCDANTAAQVSKFLVEHHLMQPDGWVEFCKSGTFGPNYRKRKFGLD